MRQIEILAPTFSWSDRSSVCEISGYINNFRLELAYKKVASASTCQAGSTHHEGEINMISLSCFPFVSASTIGETVLCVDEDFTDTTTLSILGFLHETMISGIQNVSGISGIHRAGYTPEILMPAELLVLQKHFQIPLGRQDCHVLPRNSLASAPEVVLEEGEEAESVVNAADSGNT